MLILFNPQCPCSVSAVSIIFSASATSAALMTFSVSAATAAAVYLCCINYLLHRWLIVSIYNWMRELISSIADNTFLKRKVAFQKLKRNISLHWFLQACVDFYSILNVLVQSQSSTISAASVISASLIFSASAAAAAAVCLYCSFLSLLQLSASAAAAHLCCSYLPLLLQTADSFNISLKGKN